MLINNLKIAMRNFKKRKEYALLNILGLSIGMVCCLFIFRYVSYERSFENFNPKKTDIVRLRLDSYQNEKMSWQSATIYPAIGPTMKKDFPEVENFCRLHDAEMLLSNDERQIKFGETKGYFADPASVSMLKINLVKGKEENVLDAPYKLILSESTAKKYFGDEEPVGKRLVNRSSTATTVFEVTGVFKDYPGNSHLDIEYLAAYKTLQKLADDQPGGDSLNSTETSFGWYDFYTYLQLKPGTDLKKFESKFPAFCDRYINSQEFSKANDIKNSLYLLPLKDIHLQSHFNQEAEVNDNGQSVAFLFMIAFFIIAIAWINYINLATARFIERAKEVGVRKVMGALRSSLINQFMTESFILNISALFIAVVAMFLLNPLFAGFTGIPAEAPLFPMPVYIIGFMAMFITGTFLSGLYPAIVLSAFQPITVLQGIFKNSARGLVLRRGLIVGQFATSVILIAGTIIVYQQVKNLEN